MQIRSVLVCVLLACSVALGQASFCTSPPGYLKEPGSGYSYFLGAFGQGRFMHGDGALFGKKLSISAVAFRLDAGRTYDSTNGMGRAWTRMTLSMGSTDVSKWSRTWTTNVPGGTTSVFSGKAAWPTVTVFPKTAAWGRVDLQFSSKWQYDGKQDVCYDFEFDGGALSNGASWGGGFHPYYLDCVISDDKADEVGFRYLPKSPFSGNSCNDAAITDTVGAYALHNVRAYSDEHPSTSLRGKAVLWASTYRTAPNGQVIATLCFGGSSTGVPAGAGCHPIYVDMARIIAIVGVTTQKSVPAWSGYVFPLTPQTYQTRFAGASTWFQAAWTDSKSKRFSLTTATTLQLPTKPVRLKKRSLYRGGAPAATGFVTSDVAWWTHLLPRLTKK